MLILKKKLSLNRHRYTNKKRALKFSQISPNKVVIKSKEGHLLSPQQREVYKSILSKLVRGEYKTLLSNLKRPLQTDIGKGIVVALTQTFELKTKRVSKHDSRVIFLLKTVCFLDSYGELNKIIKIRNMKQIIFLGINKFLQRSYLMGTLKLLFGYIACLYLKRLKTDCVIGSRNVIYQGNSVYKLNTMHVPRNKNFSILSTSKNITTITCVVKLRKENYYRQTIIRINKPITYFIKRNMMLGRVLNLLNKRDRTVINRPSILSTQHIITKNHRDFSLYNSFGRFAEPKNLTRSTHDANIDYFSDFKIMRFGVVGVKVWFQVKKRKPYFYRFSFLFLCIALSIFQLYILARASIIASVFSFFIRTYALQDKHIAAKYILPILTFFTKNRMCCRILLFCANFTDKFFKHKYERLINATILTSKIIFCIGVVIRALLATSHWVPYPELLLFLVGLNGLFRAIINLGILLTSGDNLLKQFLEMLNRNANKIIPRIPPIVPTPPSDSNNNDNENKKDSENKEKEKKDNKTDSEKQEKDTNSEKKKGNFNITNITAIVAASTGVATLGLGVWEKNSETLRMDEERRHQEQKMDEERRHQEQKMDEERRHQEQKKENARIEKQRSADEERRHQEQRMDEERRHQEQRMDEERRHQERLEEKKTRMAPTKKQEIKHSEILKTMAERRNEGKPLYPEFSKTIEETKNEEKEPFAEFLKTVKDTKDDRNKRFAELQRISEERRKQK